MSTHLSSTEVAAILGVHMRTLERWRKEGRGPEHIRPVNGRYLYPVETLKVWASDNNVTTLKEVA